MPPALAVALHWCHTATALPVGQGHRRRGGEVVGRLRILTMALDVWEPYRSNCAPPPLRGPCLDYTRAHHLQLTDMPPELQTLGLGFALGWPAWRLTTNCWDGGPVCLPATGWREDLWLTATSRRRNWKQSAKYVHRTHLQVCDKS